MMYLFKKSLVKVKIRDFEPLTDNDKTIQRKLDLKKKIEEKINVEKTKKRCEGIFFSLRVIYYLNDNTRILGQYIKDLDNMTKIVADTLTDYLSDQDKVNKQKTGLGLIHDDRDIHELHLIKKFVKKDIDRGLDIELYKWDKNPSTPKTSILSSMNSSKNN